MLNRRRAARRSEKTATLVGSDVPRKCRIDQQQCPAIIDAATVAGKVRGECAAAYRRSLVCVQSAATETCRVIFQNRIFEHQNRAGSCIDDTATETVRNIRRDPSRLNCQVAASILDGTAVSHRCLIAAQESRSVVEGGKLTARNHNRFIPN